LKAAVAGFALAALVALGALLIVTAEEWWPIAMGVLGALLVFSLLALAMAGSEQFWSL
jgi:hypothetical protein